MRPYSVEKSSYGGGDGWGSYLGAPNDNCEAYFILISTFRKKIMFHKGFFYESASEWRKVSFMKARLNGERFKNLSPFRRALSQEVRKK